MQQRADLEQKIARDVTRIEAAFQPAELRLETLSVRPRKSDITVQEVSVAWVPRILSRDA